jgi:excisionase family DNA binding protein
MTMPAAYFTPREVSALLKMDVDSVRSLIHKGSLRAFDVSTGRGRRTWRIPSQALDDFLNGRVSRRAPRPERRRQPMTVTEFFPR